MGGSPIRAVPLPIWQELLVGIEMLYLRISPVYWGCGIPRGDGSAVVVVPAFMGTDLYLAEFRAWLRRIGYQTYSSSIGLNAECPNLLIRLRLSQTIEKAYKVSGRRVHLVGHSLGGVIVRSAAAQMPDRVASVISMGAPIRGMVIHPFLLRAAEFVRGKILARHGEHVMPDCYTAECTCAFLNACAASVPESVAQTSIYTRADGVVDWRCCTVGDRTIDREVSATHIGMVFNPIVYQLVAQRLAEAQFSGRGVRRGKRKRRAA